MPNVKWKMSHTRTQSMWEAWWDGEPWRTMENHGELRTFQCRSAFLVPWESTHQWWSIPCCDAGVPWFSTKHPDTLGLMDAATRSIHPFSIPFRSPLHRKQHILRQKYIVSHGAQELHVLLLSETAEPMESLMGCASYEYLGISSEFNWGTTADILPYRRCVGVLWVLNLSCNIYLSGMLQWCDSQGSSQVWKGQDPRVFHVKF